jgi:hypothetical protein
MFIYIFPIFIIGFFLNKIASLKIRKKAELLLSNPYEPLPDIIHMSFPRINVLTPDIFLFFCIGISIFYNETLVNIEKNLLCTGICTIIRPFSIFITILPTCMPKPNFKKSNSYTTLFLSTHDLMFSGHSLFFIAIGNMLKNSFIKFFGPFLLIIARQHYTIDVCVSGLVYFFVYSNI